MPETPQSAADPVAELREAIRSAAGAAADSTPDVAPKLERPPKAELGDYSTNAAMLLAPSLSKPPRDVAEVLRDDLAQRLGEAAERIEVAGPGFLNVFLAESWYRRAVRALLDGADRAAAQKTGEGVLLEFVSANPTGPLTVASGRGAAYGDSLGRMLEFVGHPVHREYYMNDAGAQVRKFAESISARMRGAELPEEGYEGDYIQELAEELAADGA